MALLKQSTIRRMSQHPLRLLVTAGCLLLGWLATPALHAQSWNLTWSDEFNSTTAGAAPDPTKWTYDLGNNNGTGEQETSTSSRANSYQDGNGHLVIAILNPSPGVYTSAHLKTAGLYAAGPYGKIEASIQTAATDGLGSAFWSLGNNYVSGTPWPPSGEIDFLEQLGRAPTTAYGTIHGPGYANTGVGTPYTQSATLSAGFHTYGVIWTPYRVQWYLDGVVYGDLNRASLPNGGLWEFNDPFYLILSAGVGGGFAGNTDSSTVFPQHMLVDYVRVYQWSQAPAAASNLNATALSSSQVNLTWTASPTSGALYNVYGSPSNNFATNENANILATQVSATSYQVDGLLPNTTYYFKVAAMNNYGEAAASNQASVPTGSSSTGSNGNAIQINAGGYASGTFQNDTYFAGGGANYAVATVATGGVSTPAPQNVYLTTRTGPSTYTIPHLAPGTNYNVQLDFVETYWTSANQRLFNVFINGAPVLNNFDIYATAGGQNKALAQVFPSKSDANGNITIQFSNGSADQACVSGIEIAQGGNGGATSSGNVTSLAIDAGGAASGSFQADTDFAGGSPGASVTDAINTANVSNPAPTAVYQSNRVGSFSYTVPGLQANTAYKVRLHFAETYFTSAGARTMNVSINGKQVLTNFDIYATAGAKDTAVIEEFTTQAPQNGQIVIAVSTVVNNGLLSGVEVIATPGATLPPTTVVDLSATGSSPSQATLRWTASATNGATYNVYRSTAYGFLPSKATLVKSGLSATSYVDSGLAYATPSFSLYPTYYYLVTASNSAGESIPSSQATVQLPLLAAAASGIAVNCGSTVAAGNFIAEVNYRGGQTAASSTAVSTSGVANAAPAAVYQTSRFGGPFNYAFPGLTPGGSYTVRVHEAEPYWTAAGQRQFDISLNNVVVAKNYDIYAQAGGQNKAVVPSFNVNADASGQIAVQFANDAADNAMCSGIEIVSAAANTTTLAINAGGGAAGTFAADEDYTGGGSASTTSAIATGSVTNPAPQAVYQSNRAGAVTYTLPGFTAGSTHTVRLHFAEIYWSNAGQRVFNVALNGVTVLSNFDIIRAAGANFTANIQQFTTTANSSGQIVLALTSGTADQPEISGIEIQ